MAELQNFRSALNGFNREDVVRYLEYINNKHTAQINQHKSELQQLQAELTALRAAAESNSLAAQLEAAESRAAALEAELALVTQELEEFKTRPDPLPPQRSEEELEAYRRAERTERLARERAEQLCAQATGILADATAKVDEAAGQISAMADTVAAQLSAFQSAVTGSKSALEDASAALFALRPTSE